MGKDKIHEFFHQLTLKDQLIEPRSGSVDHFCLNADCFYCETILDVNDLVVKEVWNSDLGMMDAIGFCPSCDEPVWGERND